MSKLRTFFVWYWIRMTLNFDDYSLSWTCHKHTFTSISQYLSGRHEEFDSLILDEDKLVKTLRKDLEGRGGRVLDFHTCNIFPADWFDLVLVLRASTEVLYDRLQVVVRRFS